MSRSNIPKPNDKGKIWIGLDYLITFPNNFYLKSKIKVSFSKKESRTLIITMNGKFYQQLFSNFPPKLKRNVSFLVTSVKPSFPWNLVEDILGSSHTWDQEGLACVTLSFPWCNGWWPGFCKACGFLSVPLKLLSGNCLLHSLLFISQNPNQGAGGSLFPLNGCWEELVFMP